MNDSLYLYYPIHVLLIVISLLGYGVYLLIVDKGSKDSNQKQLYLIRQLIPVELFAGLFLIIRFLTRMNIEEFEDGIDGFTPLQIIVGILIFALVVLLIYLWLESSGKIRTKDKEENTDTTSQREANVFTLDDELLMTYSLEIERVIEEKKLYLLPDLTLDDLCDELGIAKHWISQVFNRSYGKTFYQYIAKRRIEEVVSRMEKNDKLTIESLAHECGFNSVTTFNKHFKSFIGMTPSEYRRSKNGGLQSS